MGQEKGREDSYNDIGICVDENALGRGRNGDHQKIPTRGFRIDSTRGEAGVSR